MLVSIIIPMRNEERFVAACVDSVLAQIADRTDDVEVLCVDGRSTDRTPQIIAEYARRDPRIRLLDNPAQIVPTAMNVALRQARGDVIIRLDCHAAYAPDYIARCVEVLRRTGADNVGGYIATRPGADTPVGRAIAAATSSPFGVGGSRFRVGGPEQEVDAVPFGCFCRDVFDRYGLYDERLVRNQDLELSSRIRRGGGRIVISPEIKLTYYNRSTLAGLRQQAFHNGLWNAYTLYLVGGGLRPRHLAPLGFVTCLLLLAATGAFWPPAWAGLAVVAGLYLAVGLVCAWQTRRAARASSWLVLLAFINLHLAYGIGSLAGLVAAPLKFRLKRRVPPPPALPDRRD